MQIFSNWMGLAAPGGLSCDSNMMGLTVRSAATANISMKRLKYFEYAALFVFICTSAA